MVDVALKCPIGPLRQVGLRPESCRISSLKPTTQDAPSGCRKPLFYLGIFSAQKKSAYDNMRARAHESTIYVYDTKRKSCLRCGGRTIYDSIN